ncbi:sulfatase-like hydrolase/transferase [Chloroflexi bacterium TSY]|nr:sulfatase-like hydrolase/transferase [Chloroflexi bacterium TSY]
MRNTPAQLGFSTHIEIPANSTLEATAAQWITEQTSHRPKPYFLSISFDDVHRPFGNEYNPALVDQLIVPPYLPDIPLVCRDLATLHHVIEQLDAKVGQILDAVKMAGREDDTLIIFTTEHGPAIGRAKHTLYDSGIRTALLMKHPPKMGAGQVYHELLSNVDLLPTLLELAGLETPKDLHGRSFCPLLTGGTYVERSEVFAQHSWGRRAGIYHYTPSRAIRTTRYKYIRNFTDTPSYIDTDWLARFGEERQLPEAHYGAPASEDELYDLEIDPYERNNVATLPDHSTIRSELREQLMLFLSKTNDPILEGPIPHLEELPNIPLWEKQHDGSFRLRVYHIKESGEERFSH